MRIGLERVHWNKAKYWVLFLLFLGLPSFVLCFFALRGILSDRALAEQELIDQHQKAVNAIVSVFDSAIRSLEADLRRAAEELQNNNATGAERIANQVRVSNPVVAEVFMLRTAGDISYPGTPLLYTADAPWIPNEMLSSFFPQDRDSSEFYEYRLHDYVNVLSLYRERLGSAGTKEERARLLFAVARNQKRVALISEAAATYGILVRQYGEAPTALGLPSGLAARIELLKLQVMKKDSTGAIRGIESLFEDLLHHTWKLEKSAYALADSELGLLCGGVLSMNLRDRALFKKRIGELAAALEERRKSNDRILLFEKAFASSLIDSARSFTGDARFVRMSRIVDGKAISLIATRAGEGGGRQIRLVGALLDGTEQKKSDLADLLVRVPLPSHTFLQIVDEGGVLIAGSTIPSGSRRTVEASFRGLVPSWRIVLYHQEPTMLNEILVTRRSMYVVTFVLVLAFLTIGTLFFWRMVTKEIELSRLQADFVALVSHELRSPLTSIRQLSEMLREGRVSSDDRRQRYYTILVEQAERLSTIVENILSFSRMEERTVGLRIEQVEPGEYFHDLIHPLKNRFEHKGFTIRFEIQDGLPFLSIDRESMSEAITNIVDNAIKYSGSSNQVDVSVGRSGKDICISVRDYGIGIRKSDLKNIFTKFYRSADPNVHLMNGSGLGLSLAKSVVEKHGGRISVESEYQAGSLFTIRLPISTI
jgi:signal transduction histidine kinase